MARRTRSEVVSLPEDHGWSVREGFKAVVADRGAVRFDIPSDWHSEFGTTCDLLLTDRPPPEDECRVEFSLLRVPVVAGVEFPLLDFFDEATGAADPEVHTVGEPTLVRREGLELVWRESLYIEEESGREAVRRSLLAAGSGLFALFTMAQYADVRERTEPAWRELCDSIELGAHYDLTGRDPRRN